MAKEHPCTRTPYPERRPASIAIAEPAKPKLRVGFLLMPRFTLTAFAGFVDVLRLAADHGDRSRQALCTWNVLGSNGCTIPSSSGPGVTTDAPLDSFGNYDYLVVVGGLLHGGQEVPPTIYPLLRDAAGRGVKLVGLCTGSFVLARAGLLDGHVACVSWFHREDFMTEFPQCRVISNQMFVVDRDRLTCAGGTSVVHLAAHLIERDIGRTNAMKAMRIMIEEQPLPSRTLQPEAVLSERSTDSLVHKAMLSLEQNLHEPMPIDSLCVSLGIGRRQLERRFQRDVGLSPADYRSKLRLDRAHWLLCNTDLQVIEVAVECGFQDRAHFARAVRQAFGANPSDIRAPTSHNANRMT